MNIYIYISSIINIYYYYCYYYITLIWSNSFGLLKWLGGFLSDANLETPKLDGPGTLRRARVMEIAEIINSGTSHGQRCPEGIRMFFTNVVNPILNHPQYV